MMALSELAIIYGHQNNPEQALAYNERALAIARELGDPLMIGMVRHDIAIQYNRFGDHERALGLAIIDGRIAALLRPAK